MKPRPIAEIACVNMNGGGSSFRVKGGEKASLNKARDLLIEALRRHDLPATMLDLRAGLETLAAVDAQFLADVLGQEAQAAPTEISGRSIDPGLLAIAIVSPSGRVLHTDQELQGLIDDAAWSLDLRRVRAAREVGTVHLLQGLDGAMPVLSLPEKSVRQWDLLGERLVGCPPGSTVLVNLRQATVSLRVIQAAKACGLTPVEALLLEALTQAPDLGAASAAAGLGRETGKDILVRIMRRLHAANASQAVGRVMALAYDLTATPGEEVVRRGLGLSPAEARVAVRIGAGDTAAEAGQRLSMRPATVKTYRRAVFDKTGSNRARRLSRLIFEVAALDQLSRFGEMKALAQAEPARAVFTAGGRRIVYMDYGQIGAPVVVVGHGYLTGRLPPPPLVRALQTRGFRVVTPQRPGFALTSPSAGQAQYLDDCAKDLADILDALDVLTCRLFARDGVTAALAFAERYPERVDAGLLLNPRAPKMVVRRKRGPLTAISQVLIRHPQLLDDFGAMIMRYSSEEVGRAGFRRIYSHFESDRAAIADPKVMAHLLSDLRGTFATSTRGFQMEHRVHAEGWVLPKISQSIPWTLAFSEEQEARPEVWAGLNIVRQETIISGGLLSQFTAADVLADLVRDAPQKEGAI